MLDKVKTSLRMYLPDSVLKLIRILRNWKDVFAIVRFLLADLSVISIRERMNLIVRLYVISFDIDSPHTQEEMLAFICTILSLPGKDDGVIVEAGCFKGASTAKFSIAARVANRKLVVFDSFEGIPENDEPHEKSIFGESVGFKEGDYCGALEEVKLNVAKYGCIESCVFIKGWFDLTMPEFDMPVSAIYLDVDLASSTRTCIKYLFPLLKNGGSLYSQDGHLPLVIDVFNDNKFWVDEVGYQKPQVDNLVLQREL